jgi:hypothetical protein
MALPYPITSSINGIDPGLFPFKVLSNELYQEWVKITPLSNLIGSELNRPIYRHKLNDGEGLQFRVPRLDALDYKNPVLDLDQVSGSGQQQKVTYDSCNTTFQSFPLQLIGRDIVRLGTPIQLPQRVRGQLVQVNQRNLNYDLFNQMTVLNYVDPTTTMPSFDRILVAGYNPNRATYNNLAGLTTVLNGLPALNAGSTATGSMLLALKQMAEFGGQPDTLEAAIQPAYMMSRGGWPMNDYILLIDPAVLPQLLADPLFTSTTVARGTNIDSDQPQPIHGADYIGKFFGTHIIMCKDLMAYRQTSQDGAKQASWNILLGAGALTLGWHEYPFIVEKTDEVDRLQIFTTHEQRGQKALRFPSKMIPNTTVEQGMIHFFTRIS